MLFSNKLSEPGIREMITLITHICMSREFQALRAELEQVYAEADEEDFERAAFADALYAMLQDLEEYTPYVRGIPDS